MSQLPEGESPAEAPDLGSVTSGGGSGPDPGVRLDVAGRDRSQQAALGEGTQHNYFGGIPWTGEEPVSIALPAGQRDERFPLRGRGRPLDELLAVADGPRVRVIHGMGGRRHQQQQWAGGHRPGPVHR